jgi:RNA polymerase sigma-70 factor (ECF subfamily)
MEISPLLTSPSAIERHDLADDSGADDVTALTSGLAAGDENAFRRFHSLYFHRLLRYHLVVAHGDENSAREALQETYLRVVRHARRFNDEEAFWSWLTVLARSSACDRGRACQRYWSLLARYAGMLLPADTAEGQGDTDAILSENLQACLNDLGELDRQLIEAKYLRKVTVRDLAVEYSLTEKAVESRLLRARRFLRRKVLNRMRNEK